MGVWLGGITGPLVVVIDDSFEFGFVVLDLLVGEHWFLFLVIREILGMLKVDSLFLRSGDR